MSLALFVSPLLFSVVVVVGVVVVVVILVLVVVVVVVGHVRAHSVKTVHVRARSFHSKAIRHS